MAAGTLDQGGLFGTLVKLAGLGYVGIAVAVLLLLFLMTWLAPQVDSQTQELRRSILKWGMSFAFFSGVLATVAPLFGPRVVVKAPEMHLDFSPDFATQGLPAPRIRLPSGKTVDAETTFDAQPGGVFVGIDAALKQVAELKQTAVALGNSVTVANAQLKDHLGKMPDGEKPLPAPVASASAEVVKAVKISQSATDALTEAIRSNRLDQLAPAAKALNEATVASFQAQQTLVKATE